MAGAKATNGELPVPMTEALTYCSEYPVWTTYTEKSLKADCNITPLGVKGVAADVEVNQYSVQGEIDSINLSKH